jgi:aminoglycoside phosphotransferase (APT) family kinase protein
MVGMSSGESMAPVPNRPETFRRPQVSGRETAAAKAQLEHWLRQQGAGDQDVYIAAIDAPTGNGSSYDTFLFDAIWPREDHRPISLVARIAPAGDAIPLMPVFDFEREAATITAVRRYSAVPAPQVYGWDNASGHLGAPFLVTVRVDGQIPPDYPPYPILSWLSAGSSSQKSALESGTVGLLAELHSIEDAERRLPFLSPKGNIGMPVLSRDIDRWHRHYTWAAMGTPIPVVDRAFDWLRRHCPAQPGPTVVSWGDSRIGNVIYRNFTPAAALDWEVAGLAPPEVDLCYLTFMHEFMEDRVAQGGANSEMPGFLNIERMAEEYARRTGYEPRDLHFYRVYGSVRFAAMAIRVSLRKIAYGVRPQFRSANELIPHSDLLASMIGLSSRALEG